MKRGIFVRMKRLYVGIAAVSLAACTGGGSPEDELPDSAAFAVPAEPAPTLQPAQADSVTRTPGRTPAATTPPARRTPAQSAPAPIQPPPPRDTRPSIPWPPDTL